MTTILTLDAVFVFVDCLRRAGLAGGEVSIDIAVFGLAPILGIAIAGIWRATR